MLQIQAFSDAKQYFLLHRNLSISDVTVKYMGSISSATYLTSKIIGLRPDSKDRDTIFYLRGPWANWVTSQVIQNLGGGLGVLLWKKFETTLFKYA